MQPAKLSYKVYQGSTFLETYRWESQTKVYVPIQSISKAAPCVVTTTDPHNLPIGWRFKVVGAGGMKEINSVGEGSYYIATGYNSIKGYLQTVWEEAEAMWADARDAHNATIAPATRPWSNLAGYQAYQVLVSYSVPGVTVPPELVNKAHQAKNTWDAWQLDTSSTNTIEINSVNSLGYTTYTNGGVIEYNMPVDLAGYKARMQVRKTIGSNEVIYQASSDSGEIDIDLNLNTITINIEASVTQSFGFTSAVYSLELYKDDGTVLPFLTGNLTLVQEITR